MKNRPKTPQLNLEQLQRRTDEIQRLILEYEKSDQTRQPADQHRQRLIEELQLYQSELQMQNEQLRQVTEEMAHTWDRFEDLYDAAPVGYVTLDEFGLIRESNLTLALYLQTDRLILEQGRFDTFVAPEHLKLFSAFLHKLQQSQTKQTCELTLLRPGGHALEVRLEGVVKKSGARQISQFRLAVIDITEQKMAQHQLSESQAFVHKIADTMPDILTVYDVNNRQNLYGNREIYALLGISAEMIRVMTQQERLELIHPDDQAIFIQNMASCRNLEDNEVVEFEYRIRNVVGRYLWLHVRSVVFKRDAGGQVSQILSIQQDVTFKKETEEELRYKNQIINGLQSNLPVVVSLLRYYGTFETMAGSGLEVLDREGIGNLTGKNIFDYFPEQRALLETVFREGKNVAYNQCLGAEMKTCFRNFVFLDKILNRAVAFSIDISGQIEAENKIKAEREFSQSLLDNSVDGILAFDTELRFTAWNKVMEANTRFSKSSMLGQKMFERFPPFEKTEAGQAVFSALKGEKVRLNNQDFGLKGASFEVYLNPLVDPEGNVTGGLVILHDVKQQQKYEAETIQLKLDQQKAVLNAVLAAQEGERRRIAESLHNGVGQLLYAAKINLERIGKERQFNPESNRLMLEFLDEAIRETRTISFELMPGILEDFGLETALQELFKRLSVPNLKMNLHTNGLQRFPADIEIAVYRIIQELLNNIIKHAKASQATIEVTCQRNMLQVSAKDNGIGFEEKSTLLRTKGIGLASILNRVKLLNGEVALESSPGSGTVVSVEIKIPPKKR